jgi:hypothetical protein
MTYLMSFPMRLAPNGYMVTLEQDDLAYYAELIGVTVATHEGERELVPGFGMRDPTFTQFDAQELAYQVEMFGPPVRIVTVNETSVSPTVVDVKVEFTPLEAEGETADFEIL